MEKKLVEIKDTDKGKLAVFSDGSEAEIIHENGTYTVHMDGKIIPVEIAPPPPPVVVPKGIRYTPDGEKIVFNNGSEAFLPDVVITEMPPKFKDRHKDALYHIYSFLIEMKKQAPKRGVPMTRGELLDWGVDKRDITALAELGFIQERIISVLEQKTNKPVGGRACVYFTPLGKAFLKQSGVFDG